MSIEYSRPCPWDSRVFAIPCFDIPELSEASLAHANSHPGHYSIKVDPLADKQLLHTYGFYYTDTLIEPACKPAQLQRHSHPDCTVSDAVLLPEVLALCDQTFLHGRFHRDFNLSAQLADQRYKQWLKQMYDKQQVTGLYYRGTLAGFIAHDDGALLLHAMGSDFRGRGLARYFWATLCDHLFDSGITAIHSSVSAANLAVLNLYASLGFRFSHAVDVYHKLTPAEPGTGDTIS